MIPPAAYFWTKYHIATAPFIHSKIEGGMV